MFKYKCPHCGYVLTSVQADFNIPAKADIELRLNRKGELAPAIRGRVVTGNLTPANAAEVICPSCGERFPTNSYVAECDSCGRPLEIEKALESVCLDSLYIYCDKCKELITRRYCETCEYRNRCKIKFTVSSTPAVEVCPEDSEEVYPEDSGFEPDYVTMSTDNAISSSEEENW